MKPKRQRIQSPTLTESQSIDLERRVTTRKLKFIFSIFFIAVILSVIIALSLKNSFQKKVDAVQPRPVVLQGKEFMTIANREMIRMENNTIIRVTDKEWKALKKEFSYRVQTNSVTFYKDSHK